MPPAAEPVPVLVVDDDPGIRELLTSALGFTGYDVQAVGTVAAALDAMRARPPRIVVLDVMLPDADGLAMLRMVRSTGDRTPVLMLSSRDAVADRVAGLGVGADDYVTKPFDLSEVVARLEAILRRADAAGTSGVGAWPGGAGAAVGAAGASGELSTGGSARDAAPVSPADDGVLTYLDLVVDTGRAVARRGERPLDLSAAEFRLLVALASSPERVLSKAQLLDRVWGYDYGGDTSVVEKLVSRLRRKLDADGPPLLATVRGFGYALRAERT
ncbi:response regulator transcription factor [Actinotalea sp. M2MS4P-6]|uniref:response regulator transcription factor n=1 Tax=Actinotalea sp. M2MS4P-6 TaxID=2983762 RepID=UPI0021E4915D|nr:response regulator transcription factor [Actinotalea sp. M2MS4P-6]MCV2393718.1 response regulator transcription factor [Actinotalea sp. M2MS4P-6]